MTEPDDELTQADLFDVFSNARRRRTVRYLKRHDGECDLSSLVEQVAAWENDTDPESVTRAQRRRAYISLYQTHLPMLADHGIVEWDPDSHRIDLLADEETFDPYLDRRHEGERPWHRLYVATTLGGTVALAAALFSIGPVTTAAVPFVALALCVVVFAVATIQRASRQHGRRCVSFGGR